MEKMKMYLMTMWQDERGSMGVKEIAITVATIVLIGVVVTYLSGGTLTGWVDDVWTELFNRVKSIT